MIASVVLATRARIGINMISQARSISRLRSAAGPSIAIQFRARMQSQQPHMRSYVAPSRVAFADASVIEKGVQDVTDLFMTARDELEYAEEARGTVYYNDDKEAAKQAVLDCLNRYDDLLGDLTDEQKLDVQRKIGLKIMELKSQLDALNAEELE